MFPRIALSIMVAAAVMLVEAAQVNLTTLRSSSSSSGGAGAGADLSSPSTSSKDLLDSISKDIETIKQTLNEASNRDRSLSASGDAKPDGAQYSGHYLAEAEEQKDRPWVHCAAATDGDSIYRYSIEHLNRSLGSIDFAQMRGKPLLLVNVATFCESTIEYPLYNQLAERFGDALAIVAFPSNNFQNQEPTSDPEEIYNAIKYVRPGKGFVPKFPLTKRIDVNGEKRHPIYSFLKRSCPSTRTRFSTNESNLLYKPKNARDIRWNFEKFLIHPQTGLPVKRYDQKFLPDRIIPDIEEMIKLSTKQN